MSKDEPKRLEPGTSLYSPQRQCFEVIRYLGKGSFGETYAARQLIYGRPFRTVALKLFPPATVTATNIGEVLSDAIALVGMQEECPSPEATRHMVAIFDMGLLVAKDLQSNQQIDLQSRAFISMKLVPGGSNLLKLARGFPQGMPVALTLRYLRQMLIPLAWMHTLTTPIVHGDLKPDNILVTEDYEIIVTDFGLAARMPMGSRGGAIAYQAPELLLANLAHSPTSQAYGVAMDVYALGIMWYEMLTGQHPFDAAAMQAQTGIDDRSAMQAHLEARRQPYRPASALNTELEQHPQLEQLLNDCLAERLSQRIPNAARLLESVDSYVASGKIDRSVIGVGADRTNMEPESAGFRSADAVIADAATLTRAGRPEEALRLLGPILATSPHLVPAVLAQARALVASKRPKDAWAACGQLQVNADVLEVQAQALEALGKRDLANEMRLKAQKMAVETRR